MTASGSVHDNKFVLYFQYLTICSWTVELIGRDIFLLCVVLDHRTVIFQKEKKREEGVFKSITGIQDFNSQDRQKEIFDIE